MEYVAKSIDLPVKLVFPIFKNLEIYNPAIILPNSCSLIGLGDLVLPGFFLSFMNKFDKVYLVS